MATDNLLLLIVLGALALIVPGSIIFFILRRSSRKKPAAGNRKPAPVLPPPSPAERPKFIDDPTALKKSVAPPPIKPLEMEAPLNSDEKTDESSKIRILVVDDNEDTTENVSRLIYFEDDMEVVAQAYTGRQGVEMAVDLQPHIVLMDINMPDMDGITATKEMSQTVPFSQVIIMSVQADSQYMRQAMTAGARDFEPKPFTADKLVSTIRRVYKIGLPHYRQFEYMRHSKDLPANDGDSQVTVSAPSHPSVAPVVMVYGPKGGAGTSTIAVHLAIDWQKLAGDVVLLDADLQFGDVAVNLNVQTNTTIGELGRVREIDADIVEQVLSSHPSGLHLLAAPNKPEFADLITAEKITQVLTFLRQSHNLIVVDTSSLLVEQILSVIDAADLIVLNTTPDLPAIKNAKLFLELLSRLEFSPENVDVIVNRANMLGGVPYGEIKRALKMEHLHFLPNDIKFQVATNQGQVIFQSDPASTPAKAMHSLAKGVYEKIPKKEAVHP